MSGTFFDYEPGRIETQFSHDTEYDYINLDIRMDGDITTTTECDDQGRLAEPENHQKECAEFQVYLSSVFCPFGDFIRFLEAITLDVQECAFSWDAEGPQGEMRWKRRFFQDTGFLTVEWYSSEKKFSHRMMLNTRQAVRALYTAFRSFVESSDYDPIRYEELTQGESFALVLSNASLDDLASKLAQMDAATAEAMIRRFREVVGDRHLKGPKQSFPIEHFLGSTETAAHFNEDDLWIPPEWDSWHSDQRIDELKKIYSWGTSSWFGANLRELRSKLVEDWLALPEPPPRRDFKIPRPIDQSTIH